MIAKPKIATKIEGSYSINCVESKGDTNITKSKITTKSKDSTHNIKYLL
jgi:hypothetical protein